MMLAPYTIALAMATPSAPPSPPTSSMVACDASVVEGAACEMGDPDCSLSTYCCEELCHGEQTCIANQFLSCAPGQISNDGSINLFGATWVAVYADPMCAFVPLEDAPPSDAPPSPPIETDSGLADTESGNNATGNESGCLIAPAAGPKDVVLVIDTSGSMTGTREELASDAAKAVVDTLTLNDYVSVVRFSSTASAYASTLVQATDSEKAALKSWIDSNIGASHRHVHQSGASLNR